MTPTKWTKPRTGDATLRVRFRGGEVREYEEAAKRLRWTDTGAAFDIVAVERVGAKKSDGGAWTPISGGY